MKEIKRLSEAETEIMDVIWNTEKGVTVNTVFDALGEGGWKYTTVATFLTRLEKKGYLKCGKKDGKNFYEPRMSRSDYRSMQTDEFVNEIYGGEADGLIACLCKNRISDEDHAELMEILGKYENQEE